MNKLIKSIKNPRLAASELMSRTARFWPDTLYLHIRYWLSTGEKLNLKSPKTFNDKLQWLKLHDHNPNYTIMVDKYSVKEYVSAIIGEQYIIPTLGVWDKPEDIDFDSLPNQFVLKTTSGGGSYGVIICCDKKSFDIENARKRLSQALKQDIYLANKEWPYKNVPRRVIAEKYMKDENCPELKDYKFFCFNGIPRYCQVIKDRNTKETIDFFDMDWNHQEFVGLNKFEKSYEKIDCPPCFDEMKKISTALSQDIPFSRIDLYEVNGKCYFGEITFFPAGGFGHFEPYEWNEIIGEMIRLGR